MKKKAVYCGGFVIIAVVLLLVVFLGDKTLDMESEEISELYSYLGEVDIFHCGGLNSYSGDEVTSNSISNENKLCMAYYALNLDNIQQEQGEITTTNDHDVSLCEIGEGIRLAAKEGENACNYQVISSNDLADAYRMIYGEEIPKVASFFINSSEACYLEEDNYYCGNAQTFVYSLTPEATVYRLMNRAAEKLNGDIVIDDYYLSVSGNKCYYSNNSNDEIMACSSELENNTNLEIDSDFVREYGTLYEHTFKQDDNGNYYWYSSTLK